MDSLSSLCCRYTNRSCENKPMIGYQYCRLHILEDKGCNFSQCTYLSAKTGRRCNRAALKIGLDSLCSLHVNQVLAGAHKSVIVESQNWDRMTPENLLTQLSQISGSKTIDDSTVFMRDESPRKSEGPSVVVDNEMVESHEAQTSAYIQDSDSESLDSENEDPFKYAEVLTQEEVTRLTRDKLIRLQSLYIEQFKWLQHSLRESRSQYLRDLHQLDDDGAAGSAKDNNRPVTHLSMHTEEGRTYRAARRYHRKHGREALLYEKCQERRRLSSSGVPGAVDSGRHRSRSRCANKGNKCHEVPLPMSKYCLQHIDCDMHQVLYKPCYFSSGSEKFTCRRPVVSVYERSRCGRHTSLSDLASFSGSPPQSVIGCLDQNFPLDVGFNLLETNPASTELKINPTSIEHLKDLENSLELEAIPLDDIGSVSKEFENLPTEALEAVSKELETLASNVSLEIESNLAQLEGNLKLNPKTNPECEPANFVGDKSLDMLQSHGPTRETSNQDGDPAPVIQPDVLS